jgi:hypothetical protein
MQVYVIDQGLQYMQWQILIGLDIPTRQSLGAKATFIVDDGEKICPQKRPKKLSRVAKLLFLDQ